MAVEKSQNQCRRKVFLFLTMIVMFLTSICWLSKHDLNYIKLALFYAIYSGASVQKIELPKLEIIELVW